MTNVSFNVDKYLRKNPDRYSVESASDLNSDGYANIIVIPAFSEMEFLPATLETVLKSIKQSQEKSLCLVVVNNPPEKECDALKLDDNQKLLKYLRDNYFPNTAWIDASSQGREISKQGGVGAARKIGMDAALKLFDWNAEPLLFSLDADTEVEENYISCVRDFFNTHPDKYALTLAFKHQRGGTKEEEKAIRLYESYMMDYVFRLTAAGSPYAYYSIGSTIVCRAQIYIKAGGMRPKNGGEDFYFLQAVRKLSPSDLIGHTIDTLVSPSSRASDRVPFGTGPRIAEIIVGEKQKTPGTFLHNPEIFSEICKIITTVENCEIVDSFDSWYSGLPEIGRQFLDSCEFRKTWPKILENTPNDPGKIRWAFHTWFDAFRTLKFVHFCEDRNPEKYGRIRNNRIV